MLFSLGWVLCLINLQTTTSTVLKTNQNVVIYPTKILADWKKINIEELDCYFGEFNPGMVGLNYKGYLVQEANLIRADGTYCVAYKLVTTCWVNFLGVRSLKHEKLPVSGIVDWNKVKGELDINIHTYPAPQCDWMQESKNETTVLHCQSFPVQYDPSTGTFHDPIFEGNQAKCTQLCTTRYPNRVWIPPAVSMIQPTLREVSFKIATIENEEVITGTYIKTIPISALCHENSFGTLGLRYPDGFWLGVYGWTQNDSCIKIEHEKYLHIPKCTKSSALKSVTNQFKRFWEDQHLFQLSMYASCLITAEKVKIHKNLTILDLALLAPTVPGRRPVYRIKDGTLESNIGLYQRIVWDPDGSSNRLGYSYDNMNESIVFTDWTEINNVSYGWNGLYKYRNTIDLPNLALMTEVSNFDFALENSLKPIPEVNYQDFVDKYQEINDTIQIVTVTILNSIKTHAIIIGCLLTIFVVMWIGFKIIMIKRNIKMVSSSGMRRLKY